MMTEDFPLSAGLRARVALEKHGFRPTHSLGQNFILDDALIGRLLDAAQVGPEDDVLEIGPGAGVMTRLLAQRARSVLAVEIDQRLQPVLEEVLAGADNARVVVRDFLKAADMDEVIREAFGGRPFRVVANLPYYITADILLRLAAGASRPESVCVMVQKEAAERIMSRPGTKQWCAMAATLRWYGEARALMDVPSEAFNPPPHVDSRFIRIDRRAQPIVQPRDEALFLRVISAAFAMRRKTMANNLKAAFGLSQAQAVSALEAAGVDAMARGEALTLAQLSALSDVLGSAPGFLGQ